MKKVLFLLSVLYSLVLGAQTSEKYNSDYVGFYRAEELFEKEQYAAARIEFRQFINQFQQKNDPFYIKALYYEGIAALELFNNDAIDLLMDFNKNYPESIYKHTIFFKIGRYFYQKKDYKESLVWFNKLSGFDVDSEDKEEFYFKLGYASFHEKDLVQAKKAFYEVKDGTSQYAGPALYYYSHIAYEEKSYQVALEGFEKLVKNPGFRELVPYYITQIYYLQGRFDEITRFAPSYVDSVNAKNQTSMNHLIGDAFFKTGKYDEAVPFLEAYDAKANTTRQEDYQLGYAYYRSAEFPKAIQLFDRVAQTKDTLGQIALYHAAECYLQQGNNLFARKAFEAASYLTFNPKIQEDALYNYAILSYKIDINPYDEAIEALELYLKKYPNSDRRSEVYQYLVNVYTSVKNYASAMESLENLPIKDIRLKSAYQLVAFNYGVELYQNGDYQKAITAFKSVDKYPIEAKLSASAVYWSADSYYMLRNFKQAISLYREFINTPGANESKLKPDAYYNMAYAYMMQQEFSQAIDEFRTYLGQTSVTDKNKKQEATMRLADCYFATKKDDDAIRYYKEVIETPSSFQDQALYYLAKSCQYKGNSTDRITYLKDLVNNYPRSRYLETGIMELGYEYKNLDQNDKALPYFQQIERDYPKSSSLREALLNIGDIYYKKRDFKNAEDYYKLVLTKYEKDQATCADAVKGLVNVYKAQKQPERIEELTGKYACSEFTQDETEEIYYQSAIEPYLDSSFVDAIPELEKYLQKFQTGKYKVEVQAYLANSYYRIGNTEQAFEYYREVFEVPGNGFIEIAAIRLSRDAYNNGDFENALRYYSKLEEISAQPHIINNTRIGLMRTHFILENWNDALSYAKKVLQIAQVGNAVKLEAEYILGISYYHLEMLAEAKPSLEYVIKNAGNAKASEAKFCLAELYFKQNDLVKSDTEVRALLKMKPAYDYWIAKGLMLQTRILIAKKDLFQAEHTLKSVIDNYPNSEDGVLTEANQLWDELMQLKNKPKVETNSTPTVIEIDGKK